MKSHPELNKLHHCYNIIIAAETIFKMYHCAPSPGRVGVSDTGLCMLRPTHSELWNWFNFVNSNRISPRGLCPQQGEGCRQSVANWQSVSETGSKLGREVNWCWGCYRPPCHLPQPSRPLYYAFLQKSFNQYCTRKTLKCKATIHTTHIAL